MSLKSITRKIAHLLLPIRKAQVRFVSDFAADISGCKILEIGSGGKRDFIKYFEKHNEIILSDKYQYPGCEILDVTELSLKEEYDVILAINVIEHIFDYQLAISNMHGALKNGGYLIVSVPFFYPLHDLPHDYWRFTSSSLKQILHDFKQIKIFQSGIKLAPHSVHAIAIK